MLINKSLANLEVATEYGLIKFNDKGESKDLSAEQEKKFADLPGFSVKAAASRQSKAKEDNKEEAKKPEAKSEPAKKK